MLELDDVYEPVGVTSKEDICIAQKQIAFKSNEQSSYEKPLELNVNLEHFEQRSNLDNEEETVITTLGVIKRKE